MDLDEVDLADYDRFQRNEAWEQFDTLRREDPVHWNERHRSWLVTRHADVDACFRDRRLSSDRVRPHYAGHGTGTPDPSGDDDRSWLRTIRTVLADWMVWGEEGAEAEAWHAVGAPVSSLYR